MEQIEQQARKFYIGLMENTRPLGRAGSD